MTWPALPVFVKVAGRPVILLGEGEAADAKRRLLERAGAVVVADHPDARLAIVAIEDAAEAEAAVAALKARGLLVNAVDRAALCDFTVPAVVDRAPVLVAIGTGGVSAGLAAALRQRLEGLLSARLGALAEALQAARDQLRVRFPDVGDRRRAIGAALGGEVDPLSGDSVERLATWLTAAPLCPREGGGPDCTPALAGVQRDGALERIALASPDPDDLTLRQARWLAQADRVFHTTAVAPAILDRARADAARIACDAPPKRAEEGLSVFVEMRT